MEKETKLQEILRLHRDCSSRFGGHVLRLLMENGDDKENIALSPARLQAVLVLLANWTTPEIRKQILEMAVSDEMTLEEANILFDFANIKPLPHDDFVPKDENGNPIPLVPVVEQQTTLWHKEDLVVNEEAVEKIRLAFNACTKAIDFAKTEAKQIIDEEVCNATHGLIDRLDTQIDESVLALLVDVLYFKAAWRMQFKGNDTANHFFYGTKKRQCVQTMSLQRKLFYQETPVFQAICLQYVCNSTNHTDFGMRIYLPKDKHTMSDVLDEMKKAESNSQFRLKEVKLTLPRFDISAKVDVKTIIRDMGLACILKSADIIPECIKGLQIADIAQQIRIKVDEDGTEASSITLPSHKYGLFNRKEKIVMKVNKPFLFEIVEETTNMVLFSGVINNIEKQ